MALVGALPRRYLAAVRAAAPAACGLLRARPEVGAAAFEFEKVGQQLGVLVHMEDEARHVAFGVLRDRGLAEDVVQETMIKAWRSMDRFRGDSSVRTWVLRIAHNTAVDALRRRRERAVAPEDLRRDGEATTMDDPARRYAGREDVGVLRDALAAMDELSRTIVVLREIEGLSYQEIAGTLEVPVATVKTRLLRARRALSAALKNEEVAG